MAFLPEKTRREVINLRLRFIRLNDIALAASNDLHTNVLEFQKIRRDVKTQLEKVREVIGKDTADEITNTLQKISDRSGSAYTLYEAALRKIDNFLAAH